MVVELNMHIRSPHSSLSPRVGPLQPRIGIVVGYGWMDACKIGWMDAYDPKIQISSILSQWAQNQSFSGKLIDVVRNSFFQSISWKQVNNIVYQ